MGGKEGDCSKFKETIPHYCKKDPNNCWVLSPCAQDSINVVATLHVVLKHCNRICWILCP
ncbi:hypothetical protein MTR_2g059330 [Medicago truncatula]|uniref:Uncharacterized protein n=1 Tax=Medicago truncatula TaxID=3880 RepID=G7IT22_MEDTR|nr:hypothetical protein MTR_2g059330 [Medicago truncatula]